MISTRFTKEFGVDHPIVCGGMTGVGTAELIAAVANAGALGFLSAHTPGAPEDLDAEVRRTRALTDRPFGVNLTILPTMHALPYDEYQQVIIDNKIPVVETAGSSPAPYLPAFKAAGIRVVHKAVAVRHALSAERLGIDAVSVDGFECAGHPGEDDVPGLVLIPAMATRVRVPIIASGGFATGAGLVAALALGADAINMGTRFVATAEAKVHQNVKDEIVANSERDTNVVFRKFRNSARVAKNPVSDEILEIERREGTTFADVAHLASGERGRKRVLTDGAMDDGLWWVGQAQALVTEVLTCQQVVESIIAEAEEVIRGRLSSAVAGGVPRHGRA